MKRVQAAPVRYGRADVVLDALWRLVERHLPVDGPSLPVDEVPAQPVVCIGAETL